MSAPFASYLPSSPSNFFVAVSSEKSLKSAVRNLLTAFACLLALVGAAGFAAVRQAGRPVGEVVVSIGNELDNYFISERGVKALLTRGGQEPVVGTRPEGPRLRELEGRLLAYPFVKNAQVYRDLAGNLHADIEQNRPIARLTHADARLDTYVDASGAAAAAFAPLHGAGGDGGAGRRGGPAGHVFPGQHRAALPRFFALRGRASILAGAGGGGLC